MECRYKRSCKQMEYDVFIDCIKIFACFFVVIGHLLQSLVFSNIQENTLAYTVFVNVIYLFHIQLFFASSGYLYQKRTIMDSFSDWKDNLSLKTIKLGIPYIFFSTITWILKEIMNNEVNIPNKNGLLYTLFINPISPYWYLASLILLFAIPVIKKGNTVVLYFFIAIGIHVFSIKSNVGIPLIISRAMIYGLVFFVFGMMFSYYKDKIDTINIRSFVYLIGMIIWITISICCTANNILTWPITAILGLVICFLIFMFFNSVSISDIVSKYIRNASKCTFPIFLMHTLFAAPVRIILLKLEIDNLIIHTILGLGASILGPVLIYEIYVRIGLDAAYKGFINKVESKICCKRGNQ